MFFNEIVVPLFLTILIEVLVFIAMKKKTVLLQLGTVVAVNMLTNPLLNFILLFVYHIVGITQLSIILIFLEIWVVIIEWKLMMNLLSLPKKDALLLSLIMNGASYLSGLLLF